MIDSLLLTLAFGAACVTSTASVNVTCLVEGACSSESAAPGDAVTFTGTPLTALSDTWVSVGGVPAEVVDVVRENCTLCDACKVSEASTCHGCGTCAACEESCASCEETLTFIVPDAPPGPQPVIVVNAYGATEGVSLLVTAPVGDSDALDTDAPPADSDPTPPVATDLDDTDRGSSDSDAG